MRYEERCQRASLAEVSGAEAGIRRHASTRASRRSDGGAPTTVRGGASPLHKLLVDKLLQTGVTAENEGTLLLLEDHLLKVGWQRGLGGWGVFWACPTLAHDTATGLEGAAAT